MYCTITRELRISNTAVSIKEVDGMHDLFSFIALVRILLYFCSCYLSLKEGLSSLKCLAFCKHTLSQYAI